MSSNSVGRPKPIQWIQDLDLVAKRNNKVLVKVSDFQSGLILSQRFESKSPAQNWAYFHKLMTLEQLDAKSTGKNAGSLRRNLSTIHQLKQN